MANNSEENIIYVKDGDEEITEEELNAVAGGAVSKYSKTIDLVRKLTDVDAGF